MPTDRITYRLVPQDDATLRVAFERAWLAVRSRRAQADPSATAEAVEVELQGNGYPRARVLCRHSVDDAIAHVAHWVVPRDGPAWGLTALARSSGKPTRPTS